MSAIKLAILWLSVSECLARIIEEPSKTDELASLAEITAEIVSSCYEKQVSTLGLAEVSDSFLLETLRSQQFLPVTLIGKDSTEGPVGRESRRKLQLFLVTAASSRQLGKTLKQVKSSPWWNHMATFLILDWQSSRTEEGCSNAFEFLWTAWQMNLLKATYLCVHRTRGRLIYSYNPYTSNAPKPWHLEDTYEGKNDHPWTLFLREYDGHQRICENLEFDKTNDLAGYKIYASVKDVPPFLSIDPNKSGVDSIMGSVGSFARTILHGLNATAHMKVHRKGPYEIAMDTVDGTSDVLFAPRLRSGVQNFTVSYGFGESGFSIVTQYSGHQSQLQKLVTVLDRSSRIGLCLVALTILIFFKFLRRQSLGSAILDTLRIATNSSLTKVPTNQGARIYLAGVFFLVITIVGIYQGMLASLLTKAKPLPNMETLKDLAESGYTIHADKKYARLFTAPVFKNRFIGHDDHLCLQSVVLDSSAACVGSVLIVFPEAVKLKLHISRDTVFKADYLFVIREDWPLEDRLNEVLAALREADIVRLLFEAEWKKLDSIAKFNDNLEKNQKCKVMTLRDLTFAFGILGIGLACATVCFVVEVAISPYRSRISDMSNSIRNRVRFMASRLSEN